MPIVPQINLSMLYAYCPLCDVEDPKRNSELARITKQEKVRCAFGHEISDSAIARYQAEGKLRLIKTVVPESIHPAAIKWSVWVLPEHKSKLEERFPHNLYTTVATALENLAEDSCLFIVGPKAAQLRAKGIKSADSLIALVEDYGRLESAVDDLQKELDKMKPLQALLGGLLKNQPSAP